MKEGVFFKEKANSIVPSFFYTVPNTSYLERVKR